MSITRDQHGNITATGNGVTIYQLCAQKAMLKMEAKGLKSSGGPLRPRLAASLGLKPRDSHDKFIAAIDAKVAEYKVKASGGQNI